MNLRGGKNDGVGGGEFVTVPGAGANTKLCPPAMATSCLPGFQPKYSRTYFRMTTWYLEDKVTTLLMVTALAH